MPASITTTLLAIAFLAAWCATPLVAGVLAGIALTFEVGLFIWALVDTGDNDGVG